MPLITACAGCGKKPMEVDGVDKLPAFCPDCKEKEAAHRRWLDLTLPQRIDILKARVESLEAREKERSDGETAKRQRRAGK